MRNPPNEAGAGPGLYVCTLYARKHGVGVLVFATVVVGLLCAGPFAVGVPTGSFAIGYYGIAAATYICFLTYSLTNLIRGGVWWCVLTTQELDVRTPARILGESFRLCVADLRRLEKVMSRIEQDSRYYLVDATGTIRELTSNAAFDPQRVFEEIQKLRPIEYIERYD